MDDSVIFTASFSDNSISIRVGDKLKDFLRFESNVRDVKWWKSALFCLTEEGNLSTHMPVDNRNDFVEVSTTDSNECIEDNTGSYIENEKFVTFTIIPSETEYNGIDDRKGAFEFCNVVCVTNKLHVVVLFFSYNVNVGPGSFRLDRVQCPERLPIVSALGKKGFQHVNITSVEFVYGIIGGVSKIFLLPESRIENWERGLPLGVRVKMLFFESIEWDFTLNWKNNVQDDEDEEVKKSTLTLNNCQVLENIDDVHNPKLTHKVVTLSSGALVILTIDENGESSFLCYSPWVRENTLLPDVSLTKCLTIVLGSHCESIQSVENVIVATVVVTDTLEKKSRKSEVSKSNGDLEGTDDLEVDDKEELTIEVEQNERRETIVLEIDDGHRLRTRARIPTSIDIKDTYAWSCATHPVDYDVPYVLVGLFSDHRCEVLHMVELIPNGKDPLKNVITLTDEEKSMNKILKFASGGMDGEAIRVYTVCEETIRDGNEPDNTINFNEIQLKTPTNRPLTPLMLPLSPSNGPLKRQLVLKADVSHIDCNEFMMTTTSRWSVPLKDFALDDEKEGLVTSIREVIPGPMSHLCCLGMIGSRHVALLWDLHVSKMPQVVYLPPQVTIDHAAWIEDASLGHCILLWGIHEVALISAHPSFANVAQVNQHQPQQSHGQAFLDEFSGETPKGKDSKGKQMILGMQNSQKAKNKNNSEDNKKQLNCLFGLPWRYVELEHLKNKFSNGNIMMVQMPQFDGKCFLVDGNLVETLEFSEMVKDVVPRPFYHPYSLSVAMWCNDDILRLMLEELKAHTGVSLHRSHEDRLHTYDHLVSGLSQKAQMLSRPLSPTKMEELRNLISGTSSMGGMNNNMMMDFSMEALDIPLKSSIDQLASQVLEDLLERIDDDDIQEQFRSFGISSTDNPNHKIQKYKLKIELPLTNLSILYLLARLKVVSKPNDPSLDELAKLVHHRWAIANELNAFTKGLKDDLPVNDHLLKISGSRKMDSIDLCLAWHSASQTPLANLLASQGQNGICNSAVALWVRSTLSLRKVTELASRTEYGFKRDPHSCDLLYVALGNRVALAKLFAVDKNTRVHDLLLRDFKEAHWKSVASKNAFALLRKHRYQTAAAFFLLAGRVNDAVNICLRNLHNWPLALLVARLSENGWGEISRRVLLKHVVPLAADSGDLTLLYLCAQWIEIAGFSDNVAKLDEHPPPTKLLPLFEPTMIISRNTTRQTSVTSLKANKNESKDVVKKTLCNHSSVRGVAKAHSECDCMDFMLKRHSMISTCDGRLVHLAKTALKQAQYNSRSRLSFEEQQVANDMIKSLKSHMVHDAIDLGHTIAAVCLMEGDMSNSGHVDDHQSKPSELKWLASILATLSMAAKEQSKEWEHRNGRIATEAATQKQQQQLPRTPSTASISSLGSSNISTPRSIGSLAQTNSNNSKSILTAFNPTAKPQVSSNNTKSMLSSFNPVKKPSTQQNSMLSGFDPTRKSTIKTAQPNSMLSGFDPMKKPAAKPENSMLSGFDPMKKPAAKPENSMLSGFDPTRKPASKPSTAQKSMLSGFDPIRKPAAKSTPQPNSMLSGFDPTRKPASKPTSQQNSMLSGFDPIRKPASKPSTAQSSMLSGFDPTRKPASKQQNSMFSGFDPTRKPASKPTAAQPSSMLSGFDPTKKSKPTVQPNSMLSGFDPTRKPASKPAAKPTNSMLSGFDPTRKPASTPVSQQNSMLSGFDPTRKPASKPAAKPQNSMLSGFDPTKKPAAKPTNSMLSGFNPTRKPASRPVSQQNSMLSGFDPTRKPVSKSTAAQPSSMLSGFDPTRKPAAKSTAQPNSMLSGFDPTRKPASKPAAKPQNSMLSGFDPTRKSSAQPNSMLSGFDPTRKQATKPKQSILDGFDPTKKAASKPPIQPTSMLSGFAPTKVTPPGKSEPKSMLGGFQPVRKSGSGGSHLNLLQKNHHRQQQQQQHLQPHTGNLNSISLPVTPARTPSPLGGVYNNDNGGQQQQQQQQHAYLPVIQEEGDSIKSKKEQMTKMLLMNLKIENCIGTESHEELVEEVDMQASSSWQRWVEDKLLDFSHQTIDNDFALEDRRVAATMLSTVSTIDLTTPLGKLSTLFKDPFNCTIEHLKDLQPWTPFLQRSDAVYAMKRVCSILRVMVEIPEKLPVKEDDRMLMLALVSTASAVVSLTTWGSCQGSRDYKLLFKIIQELISVSQRCSNCVDMVCNGIPYTDDDAETSVWNGAFPGMLKDVVTSLSNVMRLTTLIKSSSEFENSVTPEAVAMRLLHFLGMATISRICHETVLQIVDEDEDEETTNAKSGETKIAATIHELTKALGGKFMDGAEKLREAILPKNLSTFDTEGSIQNEDIIGDVVDELVERRRDHIQQSFGAQNDETITLKPSQSPWSSKLWERLGADDACALLERSLKQVKVLRHRRRIGSLPYIRSPVVPTELYRHPNGDLVYDMCLNETSPIPTIALSCPVGLRDLDVEASRTGRRRNASTGSLIQPDEDASFEHHLSWQARRIVHHRAMSTLSIDLSSPILPTNPFLWKQFLVPSVSSSGHLWSGSSVTKRLLFSGGFSSGVCRRSDYDQRISCVKSHPNFPVYASADTTGQLCLWQYGKSDALTCYESSNKLEPSKVTAICFNPSGDQMASCDANGYLSIRNFVPHPIFRVHKVHSKKASDCTFINPTALATVGTSKNNANLRIWDILMPPRSALVCNIACHPGGASSLVYSPRHQVLVTGGSRGSLGMFDLRMQRLIECVGGENAHEGNVRTLALDPHENFVASGSSDGHCRIWDLPRLSPRFTVPDLHRRETLVNNAIANTVISHYGITKLIATEERLYSCGSEGAVKCISLMDSPLESDENTGIDGGEDPIMF